MSTEGRFLVFCIEIYKSRKDLTGKQVIDLFKRYEITDYILSCYEALHTVGAEYLINDIDELIEYKRGVKS